MLNVICLIADAVADVEDDEDVEVLFSAISISEVRSIMSASADVDATKKMENENGKMNKALNT